MCEYCGEKTKEERDRLERDANRLYQQLIGIGRWYIGAAQGRHSGHDDRAKEVAEMARRIIRRLVEDWL